MNDEITLLTPAQVANLLGTSIRTVERLVEVGRLPPPLKLGRARRWRRDVLVAALERESAGEVPAAASSAGDGVVHDNKMS